MKDESLDFFFYNFFLDKWFMSLQKIYDIYTHEVVGGELLLRVFDEEILDVGVVYCDRVIAYGHGTQHPQQWESALAAQTSQQPRDGKQAQLGHILEPSDKHMNVKQQDISQATIGI